MRSRAPAKQSGSFAKLASMRQASSLVHGSDDEMERKVLEETQFKFLRSIDTPTVCNLIEIVAPECRGAGYTAKSSDIVRFRNCHRWSVSPTR